MGRWVLIFTIAAGTVVWGGEPSSRPPVTREEVWQAVVSELRTRGMRVEHLPRLEDIDLPLAVPAVADRALRVASVCWDADLERARFRLECQEAGQCIPFLAYGRIGRRQLAEGAGDTASTCRNETRPAKAAPKPMVRAGDPATLIFVANRLRLTATVTCLERGAAGQVIRVRNQDGRVFRARVSAPALLEALPQ